MNYVKNRFFSYLYETLRIFRNIQVTTAGECVQELDNPHKKPYETLLIGRYTGNRDSTGSPSPNSNIAQGARGSSWRREQMNKTFQKNEKANENVGENEETNSSGENKRINQSSGENERINQDSGENERIKQYSVENGTTSCNENLTDGTNFSNNLRHTNESGIVLKENITVITAPRTQIQQTDEEVGQGQGKVIPDDRVIMSVPCSLHSKKPPLYGR